MIDSRRESNFRVEQIGEDRNRSGLPSGTLAGSRVRAERVWGDSISHLFVRLCPLSLSGCSPRLPRAKLRYAIASSRTAPSSSNCARNAVCHLHFCAVAPAARRMLLFYCIPVYYCVTLFSHYARNFTRSFYYSSLPRFSLSLSSFFQDTNKKKQSRRRRSFLSECIQPRTTPEYKLGLARERLVNRLKLIERTQDGGARK